MRRLLLTLSCLMLTMGLSAQALTSSIFSDKPDQRDEQRKSNDTKANALAEYEVISSSALNVRSGPSAESEILGTLPPGHIIKDGEEVGEWLRFDYNGVTAYSSLKYFRRKEIAGPGDYKRSEFKLEGISHFTESDPVLVADTFSDKFDLYLTGGLGLGLSSFTCNIGDMDGKFGLFLETAAQIYWKGTRNLYMDASLGYAYKGASTLPMHYLDIGLTPLGYYYDYRDIRFVGNGGLYIGVPLSSLKYVDRAALDLGLSFGLSAEYNRFSVGLEFDYGLVNIATPDFKLHNWGLMVNFKYKIYAL